MWLIGGQSGLFRLGREGALARVPGGELAVTGPVTTITGPDASGARLIAAQNGLFRLARNGALARTPGGELAVTGPVTAITGSDASEVRLVVAEYGLFRQGRDGVLKLVPGSDPANTGGIRFLISNEAAELPLVLAKYGLFRLGRDGTLGLIPGSKELGNSLSLLSSPRAPKARSAREVERFLSLSRNKALARVILSAAASTGDVYAVTDSDVSGMRFVGAESGLFRLDRDGALAEVAGGDERTTGYVLKITSPDANGTRLAQAEKGLFLWRMRPILTTRPFEIAGKQITVRFSEHAECRPFARQSDFFLIDESYNVVATEDASYDSSQGVLKLALKSMPPPGLSWTVRLASRDAAGKIYTIGKPLNVHGPLDTKALVSWFAGIGLAVHTLVYGLLLFLARGSDRAAGLIMHPVFRRFGLWWAAAIAYLPAVQRWLLARWFQSRKKRISQTELLSLPLTGPSGETEPSDHLAKLLGSERRIWLQGSPGMGKTAVVRKIEAAFFGHASLREAFDAFGYIPLVLPLRSVADPGKGDRRWLARLAETALSRDGFLPDENAPDQNFALVEALVRRAGFVLVLDGANEVPWHREIETAAAASMTPGLLVTSQAMPGLRDPFVCWSLPERLADAVEPLLKLYLGEDKGAMVFGRIARTPLLAEIKSGFDVRLVESLHRAGVTAFPEGRADLYRAIVDRLLPSDDQAQARLFAFAWNQWLEGRRDFADDQLDDAVKQALVADPMGVTRLIDGERREFRHDQMRGYLAARHVAGAANTLGLLAESEAEWPEEKSEQDLVWQFVASLVDQTMASNIYRWSLNAPENRIRLQIAFAASASAQTA
jgi:hypothetical protein